MHYRYPYREEHPDDYEKRTRKEYKDYIAQPEKFAFHLVIAPVQVDGKVI